MQQQCTLPVSEHREIINSKGQVAIGHETMSSMWSVPKVGIILPPAPRQSLRASRGDDADGNAVP